MGKRGRESNGAHSEAVPRKKRKAPVSENWIKLQSEICKSAPVSTRIPSAPVTLLPLPGPSTSDSSVTRVIAMDCEMVGVGPEGKKSVLARVSIVNQYGNVLYDAYVKPLEYVTDFRTPISGIQYQHIKGGESLQKVQERVAELLSGRILVGHALQHDFKVLFLSHPKWDIRDTALFRKFRNCTGRPRSLKHLAEIFLHSRIQNGAHSSVEDARAAMMLYIKHKDEWEKSIKKRNR